MDVEGGANSSVETWRYDGEVIEVTWKTAFTRGEQRKLKISYEVYNSDLKEQAMSDSHLASR